MPCLQPPIRKHAMSGRFFLWNSILASSDLAFMEQATHEGRAHIMRRQKAYSCSRPYSACSWAAFHCC